MIYGAFMNMEERLQAVVSQAETDGALWHTIIHGNNATTVSTENGKVSSVAKQLKDVRDELINGAADYLGSCLQAKNETTAIRDNALVIKSQIEELKTDTQEFRNTAESYKNMAQTTFNSISTAVSQGIADVRNEGTTQISNVKTAVAEQVAEATAQAERAENAVDSKVDTDLSNITKTTLFSKMFTTYVNGTEWYRVWPDGWIEQGGLAAKGGSVTITFLKAFSNTNYTVIATSVGTNGEIYAQCISKLSTTQMKITNSGGSANITKSWYACGF